MEHFMTDFRNETRALAVLTAAATGADGSDQLNYFGRGLKLVIDITAITGTSPTLTVTIQGKDEVSGKYYIILASAALNATGTTVLEVYPGIANASNSTQGVTLPKVWRVRSVIGGTTPAVTGTIAACVMR